MARRPGGQGGSQGRHGVPDGRHAGHAGKTPARGQAGSRRGLFGRRKARAAEAAPAPRPHGGSPDGPGAAEGERPAGGEARAPERPGERIEIPRPGGSTLRALLLRTEQPTREVPGMLWIHGDDPSEVASAPAEPAVAKLLWDHRPCVVLCLDHPAGVADCHLALGWLRDQARPWGVATDQLMVGGEGMGADLAIQLCRYERDEGHVAVAWQLPLYPSLSERWLDALPGVSRSIGYRGLPAATTIVGMDDFSREATIAFVEGMRADGVEVDFHMYRGHFSGTGMWGEGPSTREARSFVLRQFDEAVQARRAPQQALRSLDLPSID